MEEQLIDKDPNRAISLFWTAINAGDRVDSALKDMVVVMKQLDRSDEGIEAIRSFRYLCSFESQDSIDNLLLELYKVIETSIFVMQVLWNCWMFFSSVKTWKWVLGFLQKSGRIEEEAELLEHKLKTLEQGMGFGGRVIRAKRFQGKHVTMTIEQEKARCENLGLLSCYLDEYLSLELTFPLLFEHFRVLGNLGWVHLQLHNYGIAEQHYRFGFVTKFPYMDIDYCLIM